MKDLLVFKKYKEWRWGGKYILGKDVRRMFPEYAEYHKLEDDREYFIV